MLGSLADGITQVKGFLEGEDSLATLNAFRQMGGDHRRADPWQGDNSWGWHAGSASTGGCT